VKRRDRPLDVLVVAVPETAGSALYGLVDVLSAAGNLWQALARTGSASQPFRVRIVSTRATPFRCGHGIPVAPAASVRDDPRGDIVVLPELWLGPDETLAGRHRPLLDWIRRRHRSGAHVYSACSGAVMLAETGLLDGREATSHWGYQDLFARRFPRVRFRPEPVLCFADTAGRIVTAGGATSWHDLAIHIVARHASPGEAMRVAKAYLLKMHGDGQLPYAHLVRPQPHGDALVRRCEGWLAGHFREAGVVARAVEHSGIPERTLKRRFKAATGLAPIDYVQNLRIEEAKRQLESTTTPADAISADVGYEDPSFFRRLFRRRTGLAPGEYRRAFGERALPGVAR
jgi:transcriptional regulator GlxA family with amidase domain